MTEISEADGKQRYCKACGPPAGAAKLCERCGAVFPGDNDGLTDDEGASARRVFEGREETFPDS